MKTTTAYRLLYWGSKKRFIEHYGKAFYARFRRASDQELRALLPRLPTIKNSYFDMNYKMIAAYVAVYNTALKFDETRNRADDILWMMNEELMAKIPKPMVTSMKKSCLGKKKRELAELQKKGEAGLLDPLDWRVTVAECPDGSYYYNITECGAFKALKAIGEDKVFPCICRLDYLTAHIAGIRFERNKTIADGDDCCDNHIMGIGHTRWSPEQGFENRR
jgi:uncharacterized ParB-like nuclease family protein